MNFPVEEFVPHSHVPYGKTGSGFFSDHVPAYFQVMNEAMPYVMDALDDLAVHRLQKRTFQIADYGTADGGTSMPLMSEIIERVKYTYGQEQDIHIHYEDQATNDFASLFQRLHGDQSYLKMSKSIYVSACGTGFYSQCFPRQSIDLGFSATAMHWLFKRPCNLKAALHHTGSTNEVEKKLFFEEAKRSWETILLHRAEELVPGGHMIICNVGIDENGQFSGHTQRVKAKKFEVMTNIWKDMVKDDIITEDEFVATTLNEYQRTEEEIVAPLIDISSPVYKAGLRLVAVRTAITPCPFNMAWQDSKNFVDDKETSKAHAKKYVQSIRVWSNSTFISGLSDFRTTEEKGKIVDEFYSRFENIVALNPANHGHDLVHIYVHIKKS